MDFESRGCFYFVRNLAKFKEFCLSMCGLVVRLVRVQVTYAVSNSRHYHALLSVTYTVAGCPLSLLR